MESNAEQVGVYGADLQWVAGVELPETRALLETALRTGSPAHAIRVSPGRSHELVVTPVLGPDGGVVQLVCVQRDVTAVRLAELRAAQLRACTTHLSRSLLPEEIGYAVIHPVHTALDATASLAYLASEDETLRLVAARGFDARAVPALARITPDSPLGTAVRRGEPVWVETRQALLRTWPQLAAPGSPLEAVEALAAVPARFEGRTLGAIAFGFGTGQTFDASTREFLAAVTIQYALAAERSRLFETERRGRARLELLAEVTRVFSAARLDLGEVLETVCREIASRLPDTCAVHLVRDDGWLELVAIHHADPVVEASVRASLLARPLRVGDASAPGRVAASGEPVLIAVVPEGSGTNLAAEHRAHLERFPIGSLLVVPLHTRETVMGTITCTRAPGTAAFGRDDLALLRELADRASLAIENARLYEEAAAARERSEAAGRAKDEFLALLGHELRNPLAPILTATRVLAARPGDEEARGVIERQARHMVRLVDDLLDVSRITSRKLTLRRAPLDLATVLREAIETARPLLEQHGADVELEVPRRGARVDGDHERLVQVFSNLLTNAARFGRGGHVHVALRVEDGEAVTTVRDEGVGIDAELLPRIFDLFAQGAQSADRSIGGLGLGLAIVRSLVEMHGGAVEAASPGPGRGSTFTVRLPALPTAEVAAPEPEPSPAPTVPRRRVLVVDDNRDAADALAKLLELQGHDVDVAYDAASALEAVRRRRPDLALVDIGLPDMDGWELGRRLRALPDTGALEIVALTGYGQESDRQRSREAGFARHLVKPLDPDELDALLADQPSA